MLDATKSWKEKLKCSFFHSQGSQFRQTYPARGRLIAGEIEFENQFPPWIRNSRLVFKMMCRCSQIWQEKVWTDTRYFFVLFHSPSSVKHPAEDLNFWCLVPLFSKCQFTDKVSLFAAVRVQRSLNESYFWCVSINKYTQTAFILHSAHVHSFSFCPSMWAKQVSGLPNDCRCQV